MRHQNNWKHGTVEREHESPRSYVIQTPDGRKYRRNRKHLKATKSLPLQDESDEELVVQPASYQQQASSEQPETPEPPELKVKLPESLKKAPYKTRSGRISKPPNRYSET